MRELALVAGGLTLGFAPAARAADAANDAASRSAYEQAVEADPGAVHVRLNYNPPAPGSTALRLLWARAVSTRRSPAKGI